MPDAGVHENSILRTAPAVCIYKLRIGRAIPIWKERDPTRLERRKEGENQTRPWEGKKKKKRKKKRKKEKKAPYCSSIPQLAATIYSLSTLPYHLLQNTGKHDAASR